MISKDKEFSFPNSQLLGRLTHSFASDLEAVKKLIEEGGDINAKSTTDGETVFHRALNFNIEEISDEVIIYLIENYQPDLNEHENDGITPLYMAMMENRVELVKYMLSKGADSMIKCDTGLTILDEARSERAFNNTEGNGIDFSELVEVLEKFQK
jgi:ankyrin repeat protein